MSEYINNHSKRQQLLKQLIKQLHEGATVDEVKSQFSQLLTDVGASEVAEMEQALIQEGVPETEVKRLCDVHVAVFQESLEAQPKPESLPGHPLHTFRAENAAVEAVLDALRAAFEALLAAPGLDALRKTLEALQMLRRFERHYLRKENILFPYLERHGFSGPSTVMWAIHDDIRSGWKALDELLNARPESPQAFAQEVRSVLPPMVEAIRQMVYKEENILFPAALEKLSDEEWAAIRAQEDEIGYAYVQPGDQWPPAALIEQARAVDKPVVAVYAHDPAARQPDRQALIPLQVGALTAQQINLLLTHLPVDVTLVDETDAVRFFSQTRERIFPRSPAIIGRKVQQCHPPASVHRVQRILDDFRSGARDEAEFWIQMQGKFIHIRYFALRAQDGSYQGTLEVSQDVTGIRALEGEKRLQND
ncbi:MAG: DUF438 domain-containing protein [Anaerolineae bacterium]|nr:DUF438 domain-containing protein [Anaerolineae bacterium]